MIPNFKTFISELNNNDMARSNLYLVVLPPLRNIMSIDSVVGLPPEDNLLSDVTSVVDTAGNLVSAVGSGDPLQMVGGAAGAVVPFTGLGGTSNDALTSLAGLIENGKMSCMAKSCVIPGMEIDVSISHTTGKSRIDVHGKTYQRFTVTFYCSAGYPERRLLSHWMESIYNTSTQRQAFLATVQKPIEVWTLSRRHLPTSITRLKNCIPTRLGEVQLSYENNNEVATFECEFLAEKVEYATDINSALELARESASLVQNVGQIL